MGICLCGSPWVPLIGGVRAGRTPHVLLGHFMESLESARQENDYAAISSAAAGELARQDAFEALRSRVKALERAVARYRRPGRGRPWALPRRPAASQGRNQLVLAIEQRGFTARQAKKAVAAFWDAMGRGLKLEGFVQTPLGVFRVKLKQRKPQQRQRFGRQQVLYRLPRIIVFKPAKDLVRAVNSTVTPEPTVKETPVPMVDYQTNQLRCPICGSAEFLEAEFRQYQKMTTTLPGDSDLTQQTSCSAAVRDVGWLHPGGR